MFGLITECHCAGVGEFNHFVYSPVANYKGRFYNLPFQHEYLLSVVGVNTPAEAQAVIEKQKENRVVWTAFYDLGAGCAELSRRGWSELHR